MRPFHKEKFASDFNQGIYLEQALSKMPMKLNGRFEGFRGFQGFCFEFLRHALLVRIVSNPTINSNFKGSRPLIVEGVRSKVITKNYTG